MPFTHTANTNSFPAIFGETMSFDPNILMGVIASLVAALIGSSAHNFRCQSHDQKRQRVIFFNGAKNTPGNWTGVV
jgi:hypothetical protein